MTQEHNERTEDTKPGMFNTYAECIGAFVLLGSWVFLIVLLLAIGGKQ